MTSAAIHLLVVAVTVSTVSSLLENFKIEQFNDLGRDSGRAHPCKGSNQNFTLEWTPKEVSRGWLQATFAIRPLMDHSDGKICIEVFFENDSLYSHCSSGSSFHCGHINKYFPNTCPFRKDVTAKGSAEIDLRDLSFFPNPGRYKVKARVIGLDGAEFLCAELHLDIVASPPDYEYD